MAEQSFDIAVIGGGPGGYVCAIRAAQLGMKVAIVDKRATLGGTCLNVGCIPSKALLQSSHLYEEAGHGFAAHGVKASGVSLDLATMMAHKDKVVSATVKGVDFLMRKNKITRLTGAGALKGNGVVSVTDGTNGKGGKAQDISAKHIVIATGSDVTALPGVTIDEERIVSSAGALELKKVPKTMVVVGAGVIGLELGSVWRRLGADVTVIEFLDIILPGMDAEIAAESKKILEKQGLKFRLSSKVTGAKTTNAGVTLTVEPRAGGKAEDVKAEVVLIAIGRRPYTDGLGLEAAGVQLDKRGFVTVTHGFKTSAAGIYAIGDVVGGAMLAHKAEEEGVALAELLAGQAGHVNYDAIPAVVYTAPEIAGLGKTEEQLKAAGVTYKVGKFPYMANARARAMEATEGFVKILADAASDKVLGVHIVGAAAGDLIQECVVAMEFGGSAEDIARSSHGHPGLSEIVKEAALAVDGRALHI
jgi:dihydrolipoamide dehydrogenase